MSGVRPLAPGWRHPAASVVEPPYPITALSSLIRIISTLSTWSQQSAARPSRQELLERSVLVGCGEGFPLVGRRLLLVLRLPLVIGHAIDDLSRFGVAEREAAFLGGRAIPFREAVPAKAGKVHQVDVLHVRALAQMRDQPPEGGGFQFDARLVVHRDLQCGNTGEY